MCVRASDEERGKWNVSWLGEYQFLTCFIPLSFICPICPFRISVLCACVPFGASIQLQLSSIDFDSTKTHKYFELFCTFFLTFYHLLFHILPGLSTCVKMILSWRDTFMLLWSQKSIAMHRKLDQNAHTFAFASISFDAQNFIVIPWRQ